MSDYRDQVLHGDSLEVLREIPDETVDNVVTDPPYGLGSKNPTFEEILAYLSSGEDLDMGGDFMGRKWNIPSVKVWKEIYRVLKPGGHVLAFGGSRTYDLVSMGLRAAGFDSRDTIASHFGVMTLVWIQGEGMPKSTNVSRGIDTIHGYPTPKGQIHVPKTDDAKKWEGYGTALKPCFEPILVFRKPFKGSVARNVLEHGTGALNIDAARVAGDMSELISGTGKPRSGMGHAHGYGMGEGFGGDRANPPHPDGRWPSNMVFTHLPGCKVIGTETIRGDLRGDPGGRRPGGFGDVGADKGDSKPNARVYGNEEIPVYECVDGCPIKEMGDRARFFPNFQAPFFYCAKAKEKEVTLDGRLENEHPTKKPLKLMRWLVKLVCPEGSLVLDPYCGSGSTLHAALLEKVFFLGIDRKKDYVEMSQKRIEIVRGDLATPDDDFMAFCEMLEEEDD